MSSLEPNDKRVVSRIASYEDVQNLFTRQQSASPLAGAAAEDFRALAFALEKIRDLVGFVSDQAQPTVDNAILWGLLGLVVDVRCPPSHKLLFKNGLT